MFSLIVFVSMIVLVSFLFSLTPTKIQCLISFHNNRHRLLDWYTDLLSSSPSLTAVVHRGLGAPRTVVTASPANVEYILKTNFANFPKGKPFTDILGDLLGVGIFNADGELWSTQRKLASHEFTTRSLRDLVFSSLETEVRQKLIPRLEEACGGARVLDLQEVLKRFSFDVVCRVSLGIDTCRVDLSGLVEAFDRAAEISARRGAAAVFLAWKVKRALRVGSERVLREDIETIHRSVDQIIREKRNKLAAGPDCRTRSGSNSSAGDLLTRLLLAGHGDEVVRDMVISFIMAGRDTTSSAMTWLFWLLSENPDAERLIIGEVSDVINKKTDSRNDRNPFSLAFEDLQEMRYVRACLCESMRLYPPVPWDSKHALKDDILPDGTRVAAGDRVTYFPYGMGRTEDIWGKDCLEFRPARWLDRSVLKPVNPFRFPVFQAGPRVCLGKEMAFTQMKYAVAAVLNRFEFKRVGSEPPVFVPLLTGHMAGGLKVLVKRRTTSSS